MLRTYKVKKLLEGVLVEKVPPKLYSNTNKRLSMINQRSELDNMFSSIKVSLALLLAGLGNFGLMYYLAHDLWYHKVLAVVSSMIFIYILHGNYFERLENKIREELPELGNSIEHYYTHHDGNLIAALESAELRTKPELKVFVAKIKEIFKNEDYLENINVLKSNMSNFWLQILCTILSIAKEKGGKIIKVNTNGERENVISEVLEKLSNIIEFNNIQQGYDNAEMKQYEFMTFLAPYGIIFVTKFYYAYFSKYIDVMSAYETVEAKTYVAMIFLFGNLGTLFIHWVRRSQF